MSRAWVKNIIYEQACERQGLIQKQKSKLSRDLFMSFGNKIDMSLTSKLISF